jgi:hypothetical protein
MSIAIELYLRNRVLRGEITTGGERALDLFNRREPSVVLHEAYSASFHYASRARRLGVVRVPRAQILLVAPHESIEQLTSLRGLWVPKRKVEAEVGVGPLIVRGTLHLADAGEVSPAAFLSGAEDRPFLPVTDATVSSEYHRAWSVALPSVFVARQAIEFVTEPLQVSPGWSRPADYLELAGAVNGR